MPKSAKPLQKRSRDPWRERKCLLCKLTFKPSTRIVKNADAQEFCCDNHRKEFWKHGALPFQKMMVRIEKRTREIVREELAARFPETQEPKTIRNILSGIENHLI